MCEVLIVGSGPAGAELARLLAQAGRQVLLVDALPDLRLAAFSSAALPLEAVKRFGLPDSVVGSVWRRWQLLGPAAGRREWASDSPEPLGAVLDFGALRQWLAQRACAAGARLELGWRAVACEQHPAEVRTLLRSPTGEQRWIRSQWVVDATGQQRALIGDPEPAHGPLVRGLGVEWLLQVDPGRWQPWADRLSFLLGSDWVAQGYGWVFPMQPGLLKVGVCRLIDPERPQPPLHQLLQPALKRLNLQGAAVLDRHGGLIRSTVRRRELHRQGRLLGLGDAVSTANLLGGEGIRHALASSHVLAPLLLAALQREPGALDRYPGQLRRALGWRWNLSGRLARRTWLGLRTPEADRRLEQLLLGLEATASAADLSALLFDYRFERYGLRVLPYLLGWR